MSRLYYEDNWDYNAEGLQQGWLRSAIYGRRGQRFLRELVTALDALPQPELSCGALEDPETGCCCAFGAVRRLRGPENVKLDFYPDGEDMSPEYLVEPFNVSSTLAWAVVQENDCLTESNTVEVRRRRWADVRAWAVQHLLPIGGRSDTFGNN